MSVRDWMIARLSRTSFPGLACRMAGPAHTEALIVLLTDPYFVARRAACRAVGRLRATEALDRVLDLLEDPQPGVRKQACRALGRMGGQRAVEPLIRRAGDILPGVGAAARGALRKLGEKRLAKAIAAGLTGRPKPMAQLIEEGDSRGLDAFLTRLERLWPQWDTYDLNAIGCLRFLGARAAPSLIRRLEPGPTEPSRRVAICRALGYAGDKGAVAALETSLCDPAREVRRAAAEACAALGEFAFARTFMSALGEPMRLEDRGLAPDRRELTAAEDSRLVSMLATFVEQATGNEDARCCAALTLGRRGDARAVEPLLWFLDTTGNWTGSICEALGVLGDPRAIEPLAAHLRRDFHESAVKALQALGADAVQPLAALLHSCQGWQASAAVCRLLSGLRDPRVVPSLIDRLLSRNSGEKSWQIRSPAADALGKLGDPRAIEPLLEVLANENEWPELRRDAAMALGRLRDPRTIEPLAEAARHALLAFRASEIVGAMRHEKFALLGAVCEALAQFGDERCVEPLFECIDDVFLRWDVFKLLPKLAERLENKRFAEALGRFPFQTSADDLAAPAREGDFRLFNAFACWAFFDSRPESRKPVKTAEEAIEQSVKKMLCPECLTRPARTRYGGFACQGCGRAAGLLLDIAEVTAALDDRSECDTVRDGANIRANWLRRRALFDFDRVEILSASSHEVERFVIAVGNDTDERRRARYAGMTCAVSCVVSENALRNLQSTFGEVKVKEEMCL